MKSPLLLVASLYTVLHHTTAQDNDDHSCETALSAYPKNETDSDGNTYLMQITSETCSCTTDSTMVLCDYEIEGSSDKGSTKYDTISCHAVLCNMKVTEEGGFLKVCSEPQDWKGGSGIDVGTFDAEVFEPWCVDPMVDSSGSNRFGPSLHLPWVASFAYVAAIISSVLLCA